MFSDRSTAFYVVTLDHYGSISCLVASAPPKLGSLSKQRDRFNGVDFSALLASLSVRSMST
jgi:hypothetical protein